MANEYKWIHKAIGYLIFSILYFLTFFQTGGDCGEVFVQAIVFTPVKAFIILCQIVYDQRIIAHNQYPGLKGRMKAWYSCRILSKYHDVVTTFIFLVIPFKRARVPSAMLTRYHSLTSQRELKICGC